MGKKVVIDLAVSNEPVEMEQTAEEITDLENIHAVEATKAEEENTARQAQIDLKASAKAKLVAGEPLTEAEANTLVI